MKPEEYRDYDATGLAELIRKGDVHPRELMEVAVGEAERLNPKLNVMVERLYDEAMDAAEHPPEEGPFAGVPYLIKDMVARRGTALTLGSAFMKKMRFEPPESHEVIHRTEGAGFLVFGTTNAPEFGLLPTTEPEAYGPTANPWHLEHSPGGSSGGSAASVAAGIVPMAHGNDGGGSIRIPASACGVFGLKPSRGRNPGSAEDLPAGFAVEHCLARSVRDSAALLDITRGPLPSDRWWAPRPERPYLEETEREPGALRVAFTTRDFAGRKAHPDCVEAVEKTAQLLSELGHHVEEGAPSIEQEPFNEAFVALWEGMAATLFLSFMKEARANRWIDRSARLVGENRLLKQMTRVMSRFPRAPFESTTLIGAARGLERRHADVQHAQIALARATRALSELLTPCDVWLTPVLSEPPLATGSLAGMGYDALKARVLEYACYTPIANSSGFPAMSLPLHWNGRGLPIGVQVVGRFGDESTLLRLAAQLERAQPWFDKRPPLT